MILVKFFFDDEKISFDDFSLLTLVIENKEMQFNYLTYLANEFCGKEKYWTVYNDGNLVEIDEISDFILNIFDLKINTKKNANALYKIIKNNYYSLLEEKISEIKRISKNIMEEISEDFDLELTSESYINTDDLFKIFNLRFNEDVGTKAESLIKYISVLNKLRGTKVFFVNNLHSFYDKNELLDIVKESNYKNIRIINLEFNDCFEKIYDEKLFLIDNDLCFIK